MSNLFWLTEAQIARLQPFFPKSHGKPRVDDRRVLSGIIFVNRNGLRWRDAPKEYGPPRTLYNRWKRWSDNRRHRWHSEGFHGEAKTWHSLVRAVRRGLENMRIQAFLTAATVNLKRLAAAFVAFCCMTVGLPRGRRS